MGLPDMMERFGKDIWASAQGGNSLSPLGQPLSHRPFQGAPGPRQVFGKLQYNYWSKELMHE